MQSINHTTYGDPADVLRLIDGAKPTDPGSGQVEVRVTYAPIHPGDLLGVMGSPAAGSASPIGDAGRTPGFEGSGVVTRNGGPVGSDPGFVSGDRVAFFPASGAWSEFVAVPATSIIRLPDEISDETGAQILINTITAISILRTAEEALPGPLDDETVVLQTGAGSAVGRIVTFLCLERGITPLRLVRSRQGADHLLRDLPGAPVFATDETDWRDEVLGELGDRTMRVALDGVGGLLLGDVAGLLADGEGMVVNYGSLGGEGADIRPFPPRSLALRGVSMGRWSKRPADTRKGDIDTALRLGRSKPALFEVAGRYVPSEIAAAVAHVGRPGKTGTVLLSF